MKVRIHRDDFELSGYQNIKFTSETDLITTLQILEFDKGELEELILDDVTDFIPLNDVEKTIAELVGFVRKGNKMVIVGTDVLEVAKSFANYQISLIDFNKFIYDNRKNGFTCYHMDEFLRERCNVKTIKKRVNGFQYMIEVQR